MGALSDSLSLSLSLRGRYGSINLVLLSEEKEEEDHARVIIACRANVEGERGDINQKGGSTDGDTRKCKASSYTQEKAASFSRSSAF